MSPQDDLYFTADAALIDRLGRELVGKQETGLVELVKNAYDADATKVEVTFEQDNLTVDDNGTGMTREELISGFLRLASDLKVRSPVSSRYQRRRAGRKGIGRFATQRLGSTLVLRTWTDPASSGLELTVNWNDFRAGLELVQIPVTLRDAEPRSPGTEVIVCGLRDSWSDAQIKRCWRGVLNLQQPFLVAPTAERPGVDRGFVVSFYRVGARFDDAGLIANLQTEVLDHMHAVVDMRVDRGGCAEWRLTENRFGASLGWARINHQDPESHTPGPYSHLNEAWMKAYYAILEPSEFSPMAFTRVRTLLANEGGIRLYRNGFRVVPFGDPEDDWLRLDEAYGKRSFLFPMANRNWFGIIEVRDLDGGNFEEPTSREGLIETPAFEELRGLASSVLITAAQRIAEQRHRKTRAGGSQTAPTNPYISRVRDVVRRLRAADAAASENGYRSVEAAEAIGLLDEAGDVIEEAEANYADEASLLRLLATLGLAAAEFSHETGMTFQAVRLDMDHVFSGALEARPEDKDFGDVVERVRGMVKRLDALTAYLNELASARSVRELVPVSAKTAVEEFQSGMKHLASQSEVEILIQTPHIDGLYTKPVHNAEIASVLLNFYSNSIKALKRVKGVRRIHIEAIRERKEIVLRFSDTGDGIPPDRRERVFDLFYTTRVSASTGASSLAEGTGTGLGLWIVRQIVSRAGGSAQVVAPLRGYATTIQVRLPAAEESPW